VLFHGVREIGYRSGPQYRLPKWKHGEGPTFFGCRLNFFNQERGELPLIGMRLLPAERKFGSSVVGSREASTTRPQKQLQSAALTKHSSSGSPVSYCVVGSTGARGEWLVHIILKDATQPPVSPQTCRQRNQMCRLVV